MAQQGKNHCTPHGECGDSHTGAAGMELTRQTRCDSPRSHEPVETTTSPTARANGLGCGPDLPGRSGVMVVALWLLAVIGGGLFAWFEAPAPRFDCVEAGVLYRSGQPGADALQVLMDRYGIKTIVNLRSNEKVRRDPLGRQEIQFAHKNGIKLFILPYGDPSPGVQAEEFLQIVKDPANQPVLVHCAAGKERSGVMVAVYRMRVNHWSPARAIQEMTTYGFEPAEKPDMRDFVRNHLQR